MLKNTRKKLTFYKFSANVFNLAISYWFFMAVLPLLSHKKCPQALYDGIFL